MFNEAFTVEATRVPISLKWASAVAVFLAVIAAFIALNLPAIDTSVNEQSAVDARLHDYGLRHTPEPSAALSITAVTVLDDYALRHAPESVGSASVAATHLEDYALRHLPQQTTPSFSNSPDYALRHLGD